MNNYKDLKKRCLNANLELKNQNLVFYTFGNVSLIDRNKNVFAIKPSGVQYDKLREKDIVILNLNGDVIEGKLNPSSDTKTHCFLYNNWKDICSISHTHSTYAVGWAQSLLNVPVLGTTHADYSSIDIPCISLLSDEMIKNDYELSTGIQIVNFFKKNNLDPNKLGMTLIGSHGPFTWGKDEKESVSNSKILEEICKMAFISKAINPNINKIKKSLIDKHYNRKHGENFYYGQK
jgi:L-ribulose-5-phosphate 4-epimerase